MAGAQNSHGLMAWYITDRVQDTRREADAHLNHPTTARVQVKEEEVEMQVQEHEKKL